MNLLEALVNAIRLPELRNKILFTGGILVIFRIFANVAIPGASHTALANLFSSQPLLGLLDLFSGGGLSTFSLVAMGMNPFINATIMARSRPVRPDDDLELAGLDSMSLLKVLLFIEAHYGFWMPDEDLVSDNIRTARAFAAYICRRSA